MQHDVSTGSTQLFIAQYSTYSTYFDLHVLCICYTTSQYQWRRGMERQLPTVNVWLSENCRQNLKFESRKLP